MLLIAGLGNPGPQYSGHRHNVGFMALEAIRQAHGFPAWTRKFRGEVSDGTIGGGKVLLLRPLTFMNDSGDSVGEAARFHKLEPGQVVVVHDELDLAPGRVRVKTGGGNGGHNGLRSIDAHLGRDYRRVRVGIGHPGSKERVNGHVLSDFAKGDRVWLDPLLDALARHAGDLVAGEDAGFMNRLHMATSGDEPASARGAAPAPGPKGSPKAESHIRQARAGAARPLPTAGPMADMLKRLFRAKD